MNSLVSDPVTSSLPTQDHFARNFIGGLWRFPAAPFEFDVCSPCDGSVSATVPLSSRLDLGKAIRAATAALTPAWARRAERLRGLTALVDLLEANGPALAALQEIETGLCGADSRRAVAATLRFARAELERTTDGPDATIGGVSGHILSWGLPLTEIVTSTLPTLAAGGTVVVKPSLRGALGPVAFALLAHEAGLPPGVVNLVQGTGVDIGADLISRPELSALHVRGGERTIEAAQRGHQRSQVPLQVLRGGGNLVVVGPELDTDSGTDGGGLVESVVAGVRMNSAGGPFGVPLLAVHRDLLDTVVPAVLAGLQGTVAAPLPTEGLRHRALGRIDTLVRSGAEVLLGGSELPDDIAHRMGWRVPPTVLMLGAAGSEAARAEQNSVPLGPVLSLLSWSTPEELAAGCTAERARDGVATRWGCGAGAGAPAPLPHHLIVEGGPDGAALPARWRGAP